MLPNDASLPSFLHLSHTHTHSQPISPSHYCVSLSFSISLNVPCFNTCLATFPLQTSNLLSASVSLYVTLNFTVKPPLLTIHSSLPAALSIFNLLHLSLQLRKNKWGGSGSGGRRCGYSSLATDWRGKDRSGFVFVCVRFKSAVKGEQLRKFCRCSVRQKQTRPTNARQRHLWHETGGNRRQQHPIDSNEFCWILAEWPTEQNCRKFRFPSLSTPVYCHKWGQVTKVEKHCFSQLLALHLVELLPECLT